MRVVDGDGSVYFGYVQTSDQALERFDDLSTRNLQADEPVQISGLTSEPGQTITNGLPLQTLFFRVTGTNRTLRQSVVFSGTLIPGPPQTTGVRTGLQAHVSSGPGASPSGSAVGGAVPPRGSQLRGRALIGGTNAVDVNAAPSAR